MKHLIKLNFIHLITFLILLNSCSKEINPIKNSYNYSSVFCNGNPTTIVNVINPKTGKTWMDRNLGATNAATSSTDTAAYGDLYQWGRGADGHQCRNSATTSILSSTDHPNHANFILAPLSNPYDWRTPQNDNFWQGVNGVNNPCPNGYRLPTVSEFIEEISSWTPKTVWGAINSPLKFTLAGARGFGNGSIGKVGQIGYYWSSTVSGSEANSLYLGANIIGANRALGYSVRCIKD